MEAKPGEFLLPYGLLLLTFFSAATATSSFPKEALPTKSGYLPISPTTTNSAIYYIFYEAQNPISPLSQTPILIWLQGGPGCSSMTGNFFELGPWRVNKNKTQPVSLEPNPGSWNRRFGLLFLDNPIGTGFSIAASKQEIPNNQHSIAKQLFFAVSSFLELDRPLFKNRPVYITGESYAGKYVPSFGYYILKQNPKLPSSKRVRLAGVAIGNGLTDPVTQVATHALTAYYLGLINENQMGKLERVQMEAVRLTKMGNWRKATDARSRVLRLLSKMTGLATLFDYTKKAPYRRNLVTEFLQSKDVKRALGVNESMVFKECSSVVREVLREDVMKSVKEKVEFLVREKKVLLYQGQLDLRDSVVSTEAWIKKMKWEEIGRFLRQNRRIWKVGGELAGYVQKWKSLSHVVVLGAGHFVPADQAVNSQVMIEDWVLERGLFSNGETGRASVF